MAPRDSFLTPFPGRGVAGGDAASFRRESSFIAAWWIFVVAVGVLIIGFGHLFLPAKFSYDSATIQESLDIRDLWRGLSFDSFVNTARVWSILLHVLPESLAGPVVWSLLVVVTVRILGVFDIHRVSYQLLAGGWVICLALFLSGLSKETIAVPVALCLCLAGSRGTRLLAAILFLTYAAFIRQYWVICYFYFVFALFALRLHIANRSRLATLLMVVAFVLPFIAAEAFDLEPLTEARNMVNIERVDSPDARSAFNNPLENTGFATDAANAVMAWAYMNVPVALLLDTVPHYVVFAAFQICSLWFFVAGFACFIRDARQIRRSDSVHLRCAAFVIAYSLTQALFEPDFGSFLRHEMALMIPMLVLVFYRAHASRTRTRALKLP
jgi:hypothetical protein